MHMGSKKIARQPFNIAICPPELGLLRKVIQGELADATYIIQAYIAQGLRQRGHHLNYLGPGFSDEIVFTHDLTNLTPAPRTWSRHVWFEITRKLTWRTQRLLGIPYLNVFYNYRVLDACLQCLPGQDLVYERNTLYRFGIAMACKRLRIPYILYFEADDILEHEVMGKPIPGLLRWRASAAARYNLNAADYVICVSEPLKAHLVRKWHVPATKVVVFPNVADVNRFRPDVESRSKTRSMLGIGDHPLILFVGNFYIWHDVATLLDAFACILNRYPQARLVLVGDGEKRKVMIERAAVLGISQAIIFTGMVAHQEVPRFMAAADIAVVPYPPLKEENWLSPLKLFEYMASGNAIVASHVGQISDWISDDINGLLVPPGDAPAMAAALTRLISDPGLRSRLAESAREEAIRKHSWDGYLSNLEHLFSQCFRKGNVN